MLPTYSLKKIKSLIRQENYRITARASREAQEDFDLSTYDIVEEILKITLDDFDKTMISTQRPGTFQDVYFRYVYVDGEEKLAYIKLNIVKVRKEEAIVISFHKSTGRKGKHNDKK